MGAKNRGCQTINKVDVARQEGCIRLMNPEGGHRKDADRTVDLDIHKRTSANGVSEIAAKSHLACWSNWHASDNPFAQLRTRQ
jgi:hypothetical protein